MIQQSSYRGKFMDADVRGSVAWSGEYDYDFLRELSSDAQGPSFLEKIGLEVSVVLTPSTEVEGVHGYAAAGEGTVTKRIVGGKDDLDAVFVLQVAYNIEVAALVGHRDVVTENYDVFSEIDWAEVDSILSFTAVPLGDHPEYFCCQAIYKMGGTEKIPLIWSASIFVIGLSVDVTCEMLEIQMTEGKWIAIGENVELECVHPYDAEPSEHFTCL
ncbi:hypothetical protein ARMSODRAFT_981776 [Armillaria solidipes]|uniref:Uncharacterized protein n=1 Tax=Armillaria solidipes TaxID=1076256 RepID=A0A2H3AQJ1_9AGAR|nr:hypothetical protein ARMSODRAFT_981776 [Armillaria solidipes]